MSKPIQTPWPVDPRAPNPPAPDWRAIAERLAGAVRQALLPLATLGSAERVDYDRMFGVAQFINMLRADIELSSLERTIKETTSAVRSALSAYDAARGEKGTGS